MRQRIFLIIILWSSAVVRAQESDFWLWFIEYSDENGIVFDPLALELTDKINKLEQQDDDIRNDEAPNETAKK
jgi:hypothetical protein